MLKEIEKMLQEAKKEGLNVRRIINAVRKSTLEAIDYEKRSIVRKDVEKETSESLKDIVKKIKEFENSNKYKELIDFVYHEDKIQLLLKDENLDQEFQKTVSQEILARDLRKQFSTLRYWLMKKDKKVIGVTIAEK